ncbi:MAG: AraC family transcriptional regulator [Nevskiaceae bacterium]|nr:MAG: AraC family transcriptional regulator [Nevskiaceae bacterium]
MSKAATALTSWAKAIRKALDAAGVDSARLFAEAGLDLAALDDPNARYPVAGTVRLWRLAVAATGDEAFGLTVARQVGPTTFHALGYSLTASETLLAAFERIARYFRIVTDAAEPVLTREDDRYRLSFHVPEGAQAPTDESFDAFAFLLVRLCRGLYRREYAPLAVTLRRPVPRNLSAFERAFRAPLTFGAAENVLWFDRATFERRLEGANPELARQNDEVVLRYLANFDRGNLRARVHAALIELLPQGEPGAGKVAQALHMSERNLQRKLADEDTSYKALLNDTRRELALSYLRDRRYSLTEITYLLGFADGRSFNRAFRRWTGQAPSTYRGLLPA